MRRNALLILFFVSLLLQSGCCSCRRPPIMHWKEECVVDYEPCFADLKEEDEEEDEENGPVKIDNKLRDQQPTDVAGEYELMPGDIMQMQIFGDDETFVSNVTVAPDGRLYYGFVDAVPAEGRKMSQVRRDIEDRLQQYYTHPRLVMSLVYASGQTYRIIGRVRAPGLYGVEGELRLREAIAKAGGLMRERFSEKAADARLFEIADFDRSFLARKDMIVKPDFAKLLFSCDDTQNMYIHPGDYVYIAPRYPSAVYVLGAVNQAQRIPYEKNMTLIEAVSLSGGWIEEPAFGKAANLSKVLVLRGRLQCPRVAQVDLLGIIRGRGKDFYLMPGDIIYFQNKDQMFLRDVIRSAIRTFVQSFGITAANYYAGERWFNNDPSIDTSTTQ